MPFAKLIFSCSKMPALLTFSSCTTRGFFAFVTRVLLRLTETLNRPTLLAILKASFMRHM